jgi:predicted metalloprotease with PDZ domain
MTLGEDIEGETDLVMPVWTPGSYLVREFERHVQGLCGHG